MCMHTHTHTHTHWDTPHTIIHTALTDIIERGCMFGWNWHASSSDQSNKARQFRLPPTHQHVGNFVCHPRTNMSEILSATHTPTCRKFRLPPTHQHVGSPLPQHPSLPHNLSLSILSIFSSTAVMPRKPRNKRCYDKVEKCDSLPTKVQHMEVVAAQDPQGGPVVSNILDSPSDSCVSQPGDGKVISGSSNTFI